MYQIDNTKCLNDRKDPIYTVYTDDVAGNKSVKGNLQNVDKQRQYNVRSTLTSTAFRDGKLNLITGKFAPGYPVDDNYLLCPERTSVTYQQQDYEEIRNAGDNPDTLTCDQAALNAPAPTSFFESQYLPEWT